MTDESLSPVSTAKAIVAGIGEKNVTFLAGSIAYHAFISLIPLLVLVFFLVSAVGDEGVAAQVADTTEGILPDAGQVLLEDSIEGSVATAGTSIIGLVTLLWGSLKLFRGLDTAFSEIYDSTGQGTFFGQLRDALVVFAAIGTALIAASLASGVFAFFPENALIGVLNPLLLVVGLTAAFLPMYYYFPDVPVSIRGILPGVIVAAVGWAALQALFQVYVALASGSESADAIGAILLLLTWLYFGGLVLLVGGVVNATISGHIGTESEVSDVSGSNGTEEVPSDDQIDRSNGQVDRSDDQIDRSDGQVDRQSGSRGVVLTAGRSENPLPSVRREHELDRLRERTERLARERSLLEQDRNTQRERRYRLEDRAERLEERSRHLERENDRLRRRLDRRRCSTWRRVLDAFLSKVDRLSVGTTTRIDSRK